MVSNIQEVILMCDSVTIQHHFFSIPDPQSPNPKPQCITTLSKGCNICGPHVNVESIESECTF